MRKSGVLIAASGLAMVGGLAAFAQPQNRQPMGKDPETGKFYEKYHITQSDDGRRVYLWGFNSESGEVTPITHADVPQDLTDYGHRPGNFREYHFAESEDGRRVYVWGYNPGEGRFRLVSTAGALPDNKVPQNNPGKEKTTGAEPKPKREPGPPWQPKRN
jgi:hypothetical protein